MVLITLSQTPDNGPQWVAIHGIMPAVKLEPPIKLCGELSRVKWLKFLSQEDSFVHARVCRLIMLANGSLVMVIARAAVNPI